MVNLNMRRFSRRAIPRRLRKYGGLLILVSLSALAAQFATSAVGSQRRKSAAEPEIKVEKKFSSSRRSLGDCQLIPQVTAGDGALQSVGPDPIWPRIQPPSPDQTEETPQDTEELQAMKPLYSSVTSLTRYPQSAANEEAGKGYAKNAHVTTMEFPIYMLSRIWVLAPGYKDFFKWG